MHDESSLPDLGFPDIEFGEQETPWNLNILLYIGGSDSRTDVVQPLIARGSLGPAQIDRLDLVVELHAAIASGLKSGGSRETATMQFRILRLFFGFADRTSRPLTQEAVTDSAGRRGEVPFRETRLGGCTKRSHCDYGGIESVARCSGGDGYEPCRDAIYDRKKESSIQRQLESVEQRLAGTQADSPRNRALQAEANGLRNYLDVIRN
jgi:hypothetical protein